MRERSQHGRKSNGVSSAGGYVWIIDPRANYSTGQVAARIAVGRFPIANWIFRQTETGLYHNGHPEQTTLSRLDVRSRAVVGPALRGAPGTRF